MGEMADFEINRMLDNDEFYGCYSESYNEDRGDYRENYFNDDPVYQKIKYTAILKETCRGGILLDTPCGKCWLPKEWIIIKKKKVLVPDWLSIVYLKEPKVPKGLKGFMDNIK